MNYYKRHLGDYAKDTGHLSMAEHGAYTLLLDWYYANERAITADKAYRIAKASTIHERAAVDAVLADFFVLEGGAWHNKRSDAELETMQRNVARSRSVGRLGGRPKKTQQVSTENPSGFGDKPNRLAEKTLAINHYSNNQEAKAKEPRATRASVPEKPEGVKPETWRDWLALRKAKHAPVTETTLDGARREAAKAGWTLEAFLAEWCERGSQGLKADWLKSSARVVPITDSASPAASRRLA